MLRYLNQLVEEVGGSWNRFWYTPADSGPLSVLRFLTGLVTLCSVLTIGTELDRLMSADSVVSVETLTMLGTSLDSRQRELPPVRISLFDYFNRGSALAAAHWACVGVILAYTLGLFTRVTGVLSLIALLSYIHRLYPVMIWVPDRILAFLLFYLCLGSSGMYMSIDAWLRKRKAPEPAGTLHPSWGTNVVIRLIQLHVVLVYAMMFIGKLAVEPSWMNGQAVWWLAVTPGGPIVDFAWLNGHHFLVGAWTHALLAFEVVYIVLIWNRTLRPLVIVLSFLYWGSIVLLTGLAGFAAIMLAANIAFCPSSELQALGRCCGLCKCSPKAN